MASPQVENGYTKIANEIMDALSRIRIPGEARQVLDVIIRKTYGFNKKEDAIALSQFCLHTGLNKPHVCQSLLKLKTMNLVTEKGNEVANIYRFNKDFDTWKPLPKKVTLPKKVMTVTEKGNASLPKKVHTKENTTKDNITKEMYVLFEEFWNIYPARNGKKLEKQATLKLFSALKNGDKEICIQAVKHYADSERVKEGYGIKDPKRFLKDGKGNEYWRDWIEPEQKQTKGTTLRCIYPGHTDKVCYNDCAGCSERRDR